MRKFQLKYGTATALTLSLLSQVAVQPANATDPEPDYFAMPLEHLMQVEVTSVSKKKEKIKEAPAAVYVITGEDIRRLGVTSVPEALRIVPGIQVARINSHTWAISSRGFNNQFANKLLVLIDGRSVYTPIFSGVYWDVQDVLLEDIDRIEVIRGPGATVWGANAVNGVINVITKRAKDTQGVYASAGAGNVERGMAEARIGGALDGQTHYRTYAKHFNRADSEGVTGQDTEDDWDRSQAGFRVDGATSRGDSYTVQGDAYYGENGSTLILPSLAPPYVTSAQADDNIAGGNVLGRWTRQVSGNSEVTAQAYADQARRNEQIAEQVVTTLDVEVQQNWRSDDRNEVVWGAGYRYIKDDFGGNAFVDLATPKDIYDLWSAFIQDEYALVPDKLALIVGTKVETNDFTGLEYQPGVKTVWTVDDRQTVWGSVSRAVGVPSRVPNEVLTVSNPILPNSLFPGSPAGLAEASGSQSVDSEKLIAYEAGYKVTPAENLSVDLATYYNDYTDLVTTEAGTPFFNLLAAPPHLVAPVTIANRASGKAYGAEIATSWRINDRWQVSGGYGIQKVSVDLDQGSADTTQRNNEDNLPRHQINVHSSLNLPHRVELDNVLYFVDDLTALQAYEPNGTGGLTSLRHVPQYWRFDTRVGWKPTEKVEVSLIGQNLLEDEHYEFGGPFLGPSSQVGRSVFGRVTVRY